MRKLTIASSTIVIASASYWVFSAYNPASANSSNEDKTREYVITYDYRGDYRHHWKLKLPDHFRLNKSSTPKTLYVPQTTFYREAYVWFELTSMSHHLAKLNEETNNLVRVQLKADPFIYEESWWQSKLTSETSFSEGFEANYSTFCHNDDEIGKGIFFLRSETEQEAKARSRKNGTPYVGKVGCLDFGNSDNTGIRKLAIYDEKNNPIGFGQCGDSNNTKSKCNVTFWTSINRLMSYRLDISHLPNIKDIHSKISEKFLNATISVEKEKKV